MIKRLFPGHEIPKERYHNICIAAICIDSALKVEKKSYPQLKTKIKKKKTIKFY